jgi:hypothetical protein
VLAVLTGAAALHLPSIVGCPVLAEFARAGFLLVKQKADASLRSARRWAVHAARSPASGSHAAGRSPPPGAAYSLMMALPGTPVLRYGDEIGNRLRGFVESH